MTIPVGPTPIYTIDLQLLEIESDSEEDASTDQDIPIVNSSKGQDTTIGSVEQDSDFQNTSADVLLSPLTDVSDETPIAENGSSKENCIIHLVSWDEEDSTYISDDEAVPPSK